MSLEPVPQPPALPLIGNVFDLDLANAVVCLRHLAKKYGPIFKLNLMGREVYYVNSVELAQEVCDEKRFHKFVTNNLEQVRNGIGDGLFTAYHGEHAWGVARRTLQPAFAPLHIRDMFAEMHDLATQLVARWARKAGERINVTDDYTRLTLDSIALCAMDKRFNSFYSETMHPFVTAMVDFLIESGRRDRKSSIGLMLDRAANRKYQADIETMHAVAQEAVDYRRTHPTDKKDLLNALLLGKDPQTGEKMSDSTLMNNMITFLIAGHETTAGLLSFATYYLMKCPDVAIKAQEEVDKVVGKGALRYEHMSKLPYIEAIMRETLRLCPTAPAFTRKANDDVPTIIGGKYMIPAGAAVTVSLSNVGHDVDCWGDDVEEFKPERMYGDKFGKLPSNSWMPFGNGQRGCIGRSFAWQEAVLSLALVLQNFNLRFDGPYELHLKQTLTVKPADLFMRVSLREGVDAVSIEKRMQAGTVEKRHDDTAEEKKHAAAATGSLKPMMVVYGSNAGTCEGLAQSLAKIAPQHGFEAQLSTMDAVVGKVASPLVVVTASYEGEPTDNAKAFVEWLRTSPSLDISYAVFGCGHKDWAQTYQKIPTFLDKQMETCGGKMLVELGGTNVAEGTIFDDFDAWQDKLWPALGSKETSSAESLDIELSTSRRGSYGVQPAVVLSSKQVVAAPEKRHVEIRLPSSMTYETGDYLAVLPTNSVEVVSRVLRHFKLPWDASMTVKGNSAFPAGELSISDALALYVELNTPATQKNLATLAAYAGGAVSQGSVLEILEAHKIELPFGVYLAMLNPMRIRQYSISSSPLVDPTLASITFSVAGADTTHPGVATGYLRHVQPGTQIQVAIKKPHASFRPPVDKRTPVIMICAGTGLAPFRGFVQDRVAANASGEAMLFVGCRSAEDQLFKEELEEAEKLGAVKVYPAFSRDAAKSEGCKYVQDRLWHEREGVRKLFREGAKVYICGSSAVGAAITEVVAKMRVENAEQEGKKETVESAKEWWEGLRNERYAVDVFA